MQFCNTTITDCLTLELRYYITLCIVYAAFVVVNDKIPWMPLVKF